MTDFDIIQNEIDSIKHKYLRSAMDIISDYNNENKTKTDYKRRQIYELLQNADDCYSDEIPEISVCIELKDNLLIIHNTGTPFSARGILSLMHTDASSKHEGTIGCKGLGFRSVLNWANRVTIFTKDFYVDFSEERAVRALGYYKQQTNIYGIEELSKLNRTAILTAAEVKNNKDEIEKWLPPDFSTAIVLYCEDAYIEEIESQLTSLKFEEMLFLRHVTSIEIITNSTHRSIESIKENEMCIIQEAEVISQWKVWCREGEFVQPSGDKKKYELIIAYNEDKENHDYIRENGVLYSFFKTDVPVSFPFLIHGTFELTSERNSLVKDSLLNEQLLGQLIDFIGEIGEKLAHDTQKCSYEALRFMLPAESLGQLDREYNFTNRLKAKIKHCKIFPTIKDEYISINDSPKYSQRRFDQLLLPSTCCTLLKQVMDEYILDYIKESNIRFYSDEEIVQLINKDSQFYVDNNKNAELIALYCEQFPHSQTAPNLLTDRSGHLVTEENVKIFRNPEKELELPQWSKMCFISPYLEEALSRKLHAQGRSLTEKLKSFKVVEYAFNRVLPELVSQSKNDIERIKATIAWLYEHWEQNNRSFPSDFGGVDVRIISRNNRIVGISKCYVGIEYGSDLGERIASLLDSSVYVGSPAQIGLNTKNTEDVKMFLKCLGIKMYPPIEPVKLTYQEITTFIQYNSQKYLDIYDVNNTRFTHGSFFSQYQKEITVSSIKEISKLLELGDFYDIVCWLLNDSKLYEAVTNTNEIQDTSIMKGKPAYAQRYREVGKNYMRSWLRKVFTETKWLPTQSGQKTNVENCTLTVHNLSPVVEVLNVEYDKLIKMSGKSRKEIDLLFEKIGIAEDIVDLSKQKIYEILLELYKRKDNPQSAKRLYAKINLKFKSDMVDRLISDNHMYERFKEEGGVLAERNGNYEFLPLKEVYYVDKKIYSEDVLKNYPLLVLGKRAGAQKIQSIFCVQPIQATGDIEVKAKEHILSIAYQKEFQRILPYLYAKRIAVDSQNKELHALKSAKIILVEEASATYHIGGKIHVGELRDYELIYKDKIAYIKIPANADRIDALKDTIKFRSAVAEVITTILDVDGDKDAFLLILACKSRKEIEEYFMENGDDDLSAVSLSKSKFLDQVDRKEEFWNGMRTATGKTEVAEEQYAELMAGFNYDQLSCDSNCDILIKLFQSVGTSVEQYNQYAVELIDLRPHFKQELLRIKSAYRDKYALYLLRELSSIKTKQQYEQAMQEYDGYEFIVPNSVDAQIDKIFENSFHISLSELDEVEGCKDEYISVLIDDASWSFTSAPPQQASPADEVDYCAINEKISLGTNGESKKVELSALTTSVGRRNFSKKSGRPYDSFSTRTKEENGFIAESKVYHTLKARIGELGSVAWVSGNGYRAKVNACGDDSLGYDMWYTDNEGKKHYVEVKGSTSENVEFDLTKNEMEFAEKHVEEYEVWYVHIVNKEPSAPYELGNFLMLDEGETFFNNGKFSVENSAFRIRAIASENDDSAK